ncbi:MAG: cobalt-precorrin-7 (C(5))-methyltransferase [Salinirussus sp.]
MSDGTEGGALSDHDRPHDTHVYALGIGPGDPDFLPTKARRILAASEVVVGFDSVIEHIVSVTEADFLRCTYDDEAVQLERFADRVTAGETGTAVLMGDPNVSGYQFLEKIETAVDRPVSVLPGISSIQIAASRARTPLEDSTIVSLHKRGPLEDDIERLRRDAGERHLLVLPRPYDWMPGDIADTLIEAGAPKGLEAIVCEQLTMDGETVHRTTLADLTDYAGGQDPGDSPYSDLSVLVIRRAQ